MNNYICFKAEPQVVYKCWLFSEGGFDTDQSCTIFGTSAGWHMHTPVNPQIARVTSSIG